MGTYSTAVVSGANIRGNDFFCNGESLEFSRQHVDRGVFLNAKLLFVR